MRGSALERAAATIGDASVPHGEMLVDVPDPLDGDERRLRFALYVGLFDLLAERAVEASADEAEAIAVLTRAAADLRSAEPALRFARHERGRLTDRRELVARIRGREVAVTNEWLVPRLRDDIEMYRSRIEALRRAVGEGR